MAQFSQFDGAPRFALPEACAELNKAPFPTGTLEIVHNHDCSVTVLFEGREIDLNSDINLGDVRIQMQQARANRVSYGGADSLIIETAEGPIEFGGRGEPLPDPVAVCCVDGQGVSRWRVCLDKPGKYCVGPNGLLRSSEKLILAAKADDCWQRALIAAGLCPGAVELHQAGMVLCDSENPGDPMMALVGETFTRWVTDGHIERVERSVRCEERNLHRYDVAISNATFAFKIEYLALVQEADTATFSLGYIMNKEPYPNSDVRVVAMHLFGDVDQAQVADRMLHELYGPGADAEYPLAFRSLFQAQRYLARTFEIKAHPVLGDKMLIQFRVSEFLDGSFVIFHADREPKECDDELELLQSIFSIETRHDRPYLFFDGPDMIVSLCPQVEREWQNPEVIQRLLEAYGAKLFEPWFSEEQHHFLRALSDLDAAALYLSRKLEFMILDHDDGSPCVVVQRRINSTSFFMPLKEIGQCSRWFQPEYEQLVIRRAHVDDHTRKGSPSLEAAVMNLSPKPPSVQLVRSYDAVRQVTKEDSEWRVYFDTVFAGMQSKRVCSVEDGVVFSLCSNEFRNAVLRLDGTQQRGGLVWELAESADSELVEPEFLSDAKHLWRAPYVEAISGSCGFGAVLVEGDPLYIDGDRALAELREGETKNFVLRVKRDSFADFRTNVESTNMSQEIVCGVSVTRLEDRALAFGPYDTGRVYRCGGNGLRSWEVVVRSQVDIGG